MKKPKVIALYLPQYHSTPDNDLWWGRNFTEWTNVKKSKPLFRGHEQPKEPGELGYYNLLNPEIRKKQSQIAREYGVDAFCYYHYWFGGGKRELERPFEEVLAAGEPDFPFCLCWANESWHNKFWNKDGSVSSKILVEQTYPGEDDDKDHFSVVERAFRDPRYFRIDDKPLFMIYKPFNHPDVKTFIERWRRYASEAGLGDIFFVAQLQEDFSQDRYQQLLDAGFDMINTVGLYEALRKRMDLMKIIRRKIGHRFFNLPLIDVYRKVFPELQTSLDKETKVSPSLLPNWDHTPRSGRNGWVLKGSTPELFYEHCRRMLHLAAEKEIPVVFIKSWNEWGEGNYMEPDARYGRGWLEALRKAKNEL